VSKALFDTGGSHHWSQLSRAPLGHNEGVTIMRSHQWSEMTLRAHQWSAIGSYTSTGGWGIGSPGLNPGRNMKPSVRTEVEVCGYGLYVSSLVSSFKFMR
jgi:hypothetical protein